MAVNLTMTIEEQPSISLGIVEPSQIDLTVNERNGIINYDELFNKPKLNHIVIEGDKVSSDYKLQDEMSVLTTQEIEKILYLD